MGEEHVRWLRLLKAVFPSTPDEVLARVPPKEEWKGQELPWNRRRRRRMLRAKEVVIHLFSGPDAKFWEKELSSPEREVICLDLEIDKRHDLRSDHLFAFLVHLCQRGHCPLHSRRPSMPYCQPSSAHSARSTTIEGERRPRKIWLVES